MHKNISCRKIHHFFRLPEQQCCWLIDWILLKCWLQFRRCVTLFKSYSRFSYRSIHPWCSVMKEEFLHDLGNKTGLIIIVENVYIELYIGNFVMFKLKAMLVFWICMLMVTFSVFWVQNGTKVTPQFKTATILKIVYTGDCCGGYMASVCHRWSCMHITTLLAYMLTSKQPLAIRCCNLT